jgi:hypothetical protein
MHRAPEPSRPRLSARTLTVLSRAGITPAMASTWADAALLTVLGIGPVILREIRAAVGGPVAPPSPEEAARAGELAEIRGSVRRAQLALGDAERRLRRMLMTAAE